MYNTDFEKLIMQGHGEQFLRDYRETYYAEKLRSVISESDIYVRDYKRTVPKYRITFPFFLLSVILINLLMCIKWLFVGSLTMNENWWLTKFMIKWDRICNFNIV